MNDRHHAPAKSFVNRATGFGLADQILIRVSPSYAVIRKEDALWWPKYRVIWPPGTPLGARVDRANRSSAPKKERGLAPIRENFRRNWRFSYVPLFVAKTNAARSGDLRGFMLNQQIPSWESWTSKFRQVSSSATDFHLGFSEEIGTVPCLIATRLTYFNYGFQIRFVRRSPANLLNF